MKRLLQVIFLYLSIAAPIQAEPLHGIERAVPGEFLDLDDGRLYLPKEWRTDDCVKRPAIVILHGYSQGERVLSEMPIWRQMAEEIGAVLFFIRSDLDLGWDERPDSAATRRIESTLRSFRERSWVNGIHLLGWSAGGVMATGFLARNTKQTDGRPLFDSLTAISGFIGYQMEKFLERDPSLSEAIRVPILFCWGLGEPQGPPRIAIETLSRLGWTIDVFNQPSAHYLTDSEVRTAFIRYRVTVPKN